MLPRSLSAVAQSLASNPRFAPPFSLFFFAIRAICVPFENPIKPTYSITPCDGRETSRSGRRRVTHALVDPRLQQDREAARCGLECVRDSVVGPLVAPDPREPGPVPHDTVQRLRRVRDFRKPRRGRLVGRPSSTRMKEPSTSPRSKALPSTGSNSHFITWRTGEAVLLPAGPLVVACWRNGS